MGWAFVAVRAAAETSRDVVGDVVDALAAARVDADDADDESESERRGSTPTTRPDAADDDRGAVEEARETPPVHGDDASASIRDASASTRDASANGAAERAKPGKTLLVDPSEFRRVQIDLSEATDELGVVRRELDAARADAEVARSGRAAAVERAVHAANRQARDARSRGGGTRTRWRERELRARSIRRAADLAAAEERQRGAGDVAGLRDRIRELEAKATEAEDLARALSLAGTGGAKSSGGDAASARDGGVETLRGDAATRRRKRSRRGDGATRGGRARGGRAADRGE